MNMHYVDIGQKNLYDDNKSRGLMKKAYLFASSLILVVIAVLATQYVASRSAHLYPKDIFSTSIPREQQQQLFIQKSAEVLLDRVVGHDNYYVTVYLDFHSFSKETKVLSYDPHQVKEISSKKYEEAKEATNAQKSIGSQSGNTSGPKTKFVDSEGNVIQKLPGLLLLENDRPTLALPGFPNYEDQPEKNLPAQSKEINKTPSKLIATEQEEKKNNQIDEQQKTNYSIEESTAKQYYNETQETISVPNNQIKAMVVNLVLNKDRLEELGMEEGTINKLVMGVVGFNNQRGDQINDVVYKFPDKWNAFGKTKQIIGRLIAEYQVYLLGGIALMGCLIAIWIYIKGNAQKKQQLLLQSQLQAEEDQKRQIEIKGSQEQLIREELTSLAKTKPKEFAKDILLWLEG